MARDLPLRARQPRSVGVRMKLRLLCAGMLLWGGSVAAAPVPEAPPPPGAVLQSAPVKIANRLVVTLRGPIAGYSALDRSKATVERIEKILASQSERTIAFENDTDAEGVRVLLAGRPAFLIVLIDVNVQAGESPQVVAREAARRLETAAREWDEQHTPRYLALATASAAAATSIFLVLAWLVFRANRWLGSRLSTAAVAHSRKLSLGGARLVESTHVLAATRRAFTLIAWIVVLGLASAWLTAVLEFFPYTRPWGEGLQGGMLAIARDMALAVVAALPGLLVAVVIFFIARGVVRVAAVFFDRVQDGRAQVAWLDADTVRPTRRIVNLVVALFALAFAYPFLPGAGSDAFKGLSVLLGLMISFGGASVVGQAFSGLVLMYAKSFRAGDYVRIGDVEGTVMEIKMFTTRIRTGMGEEVTLPNAAIMAGVVRNYSRAVPGTGYVVDTVVTIGYATPWRQVHEMLLEAARRTTDIVQEPAPAVRQTALSDFYVEYRLIAYTPAESPMRRVDVLSQLHGNIQDVFNERGVQIMSPHYMVDPETPQVAPTA